MDRSDNALNQPDLRVGPGRDRDNANFGRYLARLRELAGLTRAQAAAAHGWSPEYLRLVESGRRTPALGSMTAMLSNYGVEAVVESLQPGGDRPDLAFIDPLGGDFTSVDFVSRIRETRGRTARSVLTPKADDPSSGEVGDLEMLQEILKRLAVADPPTLKAIYRLLTR